MKYFTQLALAVFLLSSLTVSAQRQCAAMEVLEEQLLKNPELRESMQRFEIRTQELLREGLEFRAAVTIPVVVHVLYNTDAENIPESAITTQIAVLNEDFARNNADQDNVWSQASSVNIQFELAEIRRVYTKKRSFGTDDSMKSSRFGSPAAPADQYLNIWVCDMTGGILGYAQFPGGNPATDGVVLHYQATGSEDKDQNLTYLFDAFNLGRTATHEVGHWLGLRHIWGDGGCSVDDNIADTPESDGANYGCAIGHVSCGTVDMVQNYMDYSDDACMNLFTSDQAGVMEAILANRFGGGGDTGGGGGGGECGTPTNLTSSFVRKKGPNYEHTLGWSTAAGALDYYVEVYDAGTTNTVASGTVSSNGATLTIGGGTYDWRVRANCSGGSEAWSAMATFTTGSNARQIAGQDYFTTVFPNPASDRFLIRFQNLDRLAGLPDLTTGTVNAPESYIVQLNDLTGRIVRQQVAGNGESTLEMNVANLSAGLYFLRITDEAGELQSTHKLVIKP